MAAQIDAMYPDIVEEFEHPSIGGDIIKVVNYEALIAIVIEALQQIHAKLQDA